MIKRFFSQSWLSFKGQQAAFSFEEFIFLDTVNPLLNLIFYCILAGYSFNTANLTSWVIGNSFLLCVTTCIYSIGSTFTSERYYGRIRSIIVSPVNRLGIILHKGFFSCLVAVIKVFIGFIVGSLIFNVNIFDINMGLFFLILLVAMFAMTGFSMFIAMFGLITDQMHFVLNLITSILMVFCGANFPISQLPQGAIWISEIIPLSRSIKAANMLFAEIDISLFYHLLEKEVVVGLLYFIFSLMMIKIIEKIAIKNASLEVF